MRRAITIGLAGWLCCGAALADQEANENREALAEAPESFQDVTWKTSGDRIMLRSGRWLQGVRVLSRTSIDVRVEVLPGLPSLVLPASQVVAIRYEKRREEPLNRPAGVEPEAAVTADPEILPALKTDPEFSKQLAAPVSAEDLEFNGRDAIWILESIAARMDVPITISKRVRARPVAQRRCSMRIEKGQTLHYFLQGTAVEAAPWLKIEYTFDGILVSLRSE